MDARLSRVFNGIGGTAQIEGIGRVGGIPPTLGAAGGSPQIMGQQSPGVNKALIIWGIAIGVLVVFHVGGARLG